MPTEPLNHEKLLDELATVVLTGTEESRDFVDQLGAAYEVTSQWPSMWVAKVLSFGLKAGVSFGLIKWLVFRDLNDREVKYETDKVSTFMDTLHQQHLDFIKRAGSY